MRTRLTSRTILRLLFAVLFGVMSVVPVPLSAFAFPASLHAHAAPAPDASQSAIHHDTAHHGHGGAAHHHGDRLTATAPSADEPGATQPADGAMSCHAAPCCMAVPPAAPSAPATVLLLLGQLAVPPSRTIVAVAPDPAVPPPRLQA